MFEEFPKHYRNAITRVSEDGYICIMTFWTKQNVMYDAISENNKSKIITIGNLYTKEGIEFIIRFLFFFLYLFIYY
jgi:hypothetical protein